MDDVTIRAWLDDLASSAPSPGGGAAAATTAAIGAALVSMVCNLTIGKPRYAAHEQTLRLVLERAESLRAEALRLGAADAAAFQAVIAAYALPKSSEAEKAARTEAIQAALLTAADVPLSTGDLAAEVVDLAASILDRSNPNVLSDVGVAASAARAALEAAVINVEINVAALTDAARRDILRQRVTALGATAAHADQIVAEVRSRLAK
ncbi:MAG TPA: cyclodeaminase/cyclohydrolase family protein [Pseudonocardiaceae bacterium]